MDAFVYVLSVNGLIFFLSIIFYFIPPKKINSIYGYRTHRTMQNKDIWVYANGSFSVTLLKYTGISFIAALVLTLVNPGLMNSWFPMAFMIFTLLISVISTEKALNENFDEDGNRKTKK
jgi:uncharacterized membrane protein|tara:strand:+ start:10596 stop:10952 length:357 start_codon:yes stop_codon:yes gene_type:complete